MQGGSLDPGLAFRGGFVALIVALAVTVALVIVPRSAGSQNPSAVSPFFSSAVYTTSPSGHLRVTRFALDGISPGERVIVGCYACGRTQFSTSGATGASLTPSPALRARRRTRVIIGATAPGLIGRWKLYAVRPTLALLAQGCMPSSVTALTAADAKDPSRIPRAVCSGACISPPNSEYVVFRGTNESLQEVQYSYGVWDEPTTIPSEHLGSAPAIAMHRYGQQDIFWEGRDGRLWEVSYTGKWKGPVKLADAGKLGSAPSADVDARGVDHVFYEGAGGVLWEVSNPGGHWGRAVPFNTGPLGSAPAATIELNGAQDIFWKGTDGRLWHITSTWPGGRVLPGAGRLGSGPAVAIDAAGVDHVFWTGIDGTLWELSNPRGQWSRRSGAFNSGALGSAPTVAIRPDGEEDVFWRGHTGRGLYEWWYTGGVWHGPSHRRIAGKLDSQPAVAAVVC
jgi:hypothetical protein